MRAALTSLAFRDGKPDPALVQALDDKNQTRRAAAVAILGHEDGRDERPTNMKKAVTERAFVRGFKHAMRAPSIATARRPWNGRSPKCSYSSGLTIRSLRSHE